MLLFSPVTVYESGTDTNYDTDYDIEEYLDNTFACFLAP